MELFNNVFDLYFVKLDFLPIVSANHQFVYRLYPMDIFPENKDGVFNKALTFSKSYTLLRIRK
ncbi:MAG: hypothetical protein ABIN48_00725 [Ginsengibacter sp.]